LDEIYRIPIAIPIAVATNINLALIIAYAEIYLKCDIKIP